jgi:hypothetical protein
LVRLNGVPADCIDLALVFGKNLVETGSISILIHFELFIDLIPIKKYFAIYKAFINPIFSSERTDFRTVRTWLRMRCAHLGVATLFNSRWR